MNDYGYEGEWQIIMEQTIVKEPNTNKQNN